MAQATAPILDSTNTSRKFNALVSVALLCFFPYCLCYQRLYKRRTIRRAITLVAPFPPGGPSDATARLITGPMSNALGRQIIVENVAGA